MRALTTGERPMARPREVEGRPLPKNMYFMPGHKNLPEEQQRFRYRKDDGKLIGIRNADGVMASYDEAVAIAKHANTLRNTTAVSPVHSLAYWRTQYIEWSEEYNPKLKDKKAWKQRKNDMKAFAELFKAIKVGSIGIKHIEPWWDKLTYDQQHNRRSAFAKWFVWMLNRNVVQSNPFATSLDRPSLISKPKPEKARMPMEREHFWQLYYQAEKMEGMAHVQIAMGIALITMMRETDICELKLQKHVFHDAVRKTIEKSEEQRGFVGASHLEFKFNKHILLKKLINKARELSMQHQRCPYVLSYLPKQKRLGKTKTHTHQVTANRLIKDFALVRDAAGLSDNLPPGKTPMTIHEIKGLAIHLGLQKYDKKDVKEQAAHTDERVMESYAANHEPTWQEATVIFDEDMIGGSF